METKIEKSKVPYNQYRSEQKPYTMYFPIKIYEEVKAMSVKQGIPMKTYILKALIRNLNLEREKKIRIVSKKCLHV